MPPSSAKGGGDSGKQDSGTLKLILLSWLFTNAAPFVVIAVIVLFQAELRRALDQVGRLSHLNLQLSQFNPQAFNRGVAEAIRSIGVSEVTYYRWRQEFGGLKSDQVKRLKDLDV